ncbi:thioredoxin family protein [Paenibacillus sp. GD4]|uniref:thioredoxin family protein n=1 Tax=Paenibacillus TaxID=44249 RepID=UPI002542E05C|nr:MULTISPECIES: thioredoxin family protein [Paenibacillus]MDQ1909755.1 thioredoxin family protein [Paenibacillus sp. GD4]
MKKLAIYLSIVVVLFGALFIVNQQSNQAKNAKYADNPYGISPDKLNVETVKLLDDPNYQNLILPEQLKQKVDNKEDFFIYFYASTCPHCKRTTPILAPMAKDMNIDLKQYNLEEFKQGWNQYKIEYTPTLVYYKGGKEVERLVGGVASNGEAGHTPETYKQFLEKYNKK